MADVSVLNFGGAAGTRNIKDASAVRSISVNGVSQTISSGAVNLDVATNLIPETQWTTLQSKFAIS